MAFPMGGKIYRLTMGAGEPLSKFGTVTNPAQGIASGECPGALTEMLDTLSGAEMGPVASALRDHR